MSEQLSAVQRYDNPKIVEHLASQYVLGTLTAKARQRVVVLSQHNVALQQRIEFWQQKFVVLDQQTPELPPSEISWQQISAQLDMTTGKQTQQSLKQQSLKQRIGDWITGWLTMPLQPAVRAFSLAALALVVILLVNPMAQKADPLSYVAVLTDPGGQAHLVASTYGESKKLIVNVINAPKVTQDQALELWVISKSDAQARSLGVIPFDKTLIEQQLTQAQWRLIKDSESLIVTVEDAGGSPIGEPSEMIVSRGLCVRLQEWQKDA